MSKQLLLRIDDDLFERIERAAKAAKRRSGQAVVEEVLELYLDVWLSTNLSITNAVRKQSIEILSNIGTIERAEQILVEDVKDLETLNNEQTAKRSRKAK